jgi:dTDP-4-amino-4,6-dideoxygalactose transaminase
VLANQDYETIVERRRRNHAHLLSRLGEISSPIFGDLPQGVCPLFYPMRTKNKTAVLQRLWERGVEAVNVWSRNPRVVPAGAFPEAETLRKTIIELPCHQDLDLEAMDWIANEVCALRADL